MKKLLILFLLALSVSSFAQTEEVKHYRGTVHLACNAITEIDGHPILPDDAVSYEFYAWDKAGGDPLLQSISDYTYIGESATPDISWNIEYYAEWYLGVRYKHVNGEGYITYGAVAFSSEEAPVTHDGPFVYAFQGDSIVLPKATGLKDSGI